jgi:hypothetical protein
VKEISKIGVPDQVFRRELEAIANFSQAKVWVFSVRDTMAVLANHSWFMT